MFPGVFAVTTPDKAAVIRATGEQLTYRELDENSTRIANHLDTLGLRAGDTVAMVSTNSLHMFEVYWAAVRSGMYITAINHHLTSTETNYILADCDAKVLFADRSAPAAVAETDSLPALAHDGYRIAWGTATPDELPEGFVDIDDVLARTPATPRTDQPRGTDMLYSSGTTGHPKGIKLPLPDGQVDEIPDRLTPVFSVIYGFDANTVYYSPAPLYHAAPLRFCAMTNSVGGTVVFADRFEPDTALSDIERYGATHSQWVPTMFVRMLKLPEDKRAAHDVSTMTIAIHAAAPCPAHVKRAMIEWWGPVIHEYYAATEAAGATFIGPDEALERPGSVGRAGQGILHICDDDGVELPTGDIGLIYFERDEVPFRYHNDPDKTKKAQHPDHENWATTGDMGYVDADGYLYLTDRKAFMIISGGVNIYPQEAESILIGHPAVYDVAVIGVPDDDRGEQVKACVQLAEGFSPSEELADELLAYTTSSLAAFKAPRTVDFVDDLPRTPTGKLVKGELRKQYWPSA